MRGDAGLLFRKQSRQAVDQAPPCLAAGREGGEGTKHGEEEVGGGYVEGLRRRSKPEGTELWKWEAGRRVGTAELGVSRCWIGNWGRRRRVEKGGSEEGSGEEEKKGRWESEGGCMEGVRWGCCLRC